jgi:hypothetical protein
LLLTLTLLSRFARALTAIRTATTPATTTAAAAFFAALLFRTLRHRRCIGKLGLIQFHGFRCYRCALLFTRFLRTIFARTALAATTLPVFTAALAAFALTTRTTFATATPFTTLAADTGVLGRL